MITNLDSIKNLNAKEMAEFLDMISPLGDCGLSFYHYINQTICSSRVCPLSRKTCVVAEKGKSCPFTYKQKIEKWLRSKTVSKAKHILEDQD